MTIDFPPNQLLNFSCNALRLIFGFRKSTGIDEADDRRLLRARRERPRGSRAAECGQQFPPSDGDCHAPLPREG
jgi:hypothetical protein